MAMYLFLLLCFLGFVSFVAGVYILFGLGFGLIAGSVALFVVANFLRKGMTGG